MEQVGSNRLVLVRHVDGIEVQRSCERSGVRVD
jgi:hypothetical protein